MKEEKSKHDNIAYIDGQNLHIGTTSAESAWTVDLKRFRIYLAKKYDISKAYYYIGFTNDQNRSLYRYIQESGFVLVFKPHHETLASTKKGNVDADIIFDVMEMMYRSRTSFERVILVSGDGDYKKLVDFLIKEGAFEKVLFPELKRASSLYRQITRKYFDDLSKPEIRQKIQKRKGGLR